ncbi:hypothetical protein BX666DRAFT_1950246 [Dichotomocladium elegans]|nr:hypothetical protein BX666DRAFT_1950246 [Dichotomocladium elegans]
MKPTRISHRCGQRLLSSNNKIHLVTSMHYRPHQDQKLQQRQHNHCHLLHPHCGTNHPHRILTNPPARRKRPLFRIYQPYQRKLTQHHPMQDTTRRHRPRLMNILRSMIVHATPARPRFSTIGHRPLPLPQTNWSSNYTIT